MTDLELQLLQRNTMALEAIRDILRDTYTTLRAIHLIVQSDKPTDYQYDLSAFPNFNWDRIGAAVIERDRYGAAAVTYGGHTYIRRSPQNKFGLEFGDKNLGQASPQQNNSLCTTDQQIKPALDFQALPPEAIWFSRCTGKGDNGENVYQRLITFKRLWTSVEPLPERVVRHLAPGA